MNKIYFISCYFVPMGRSEANRAFMVKYLYEEGWDVEVVTGENYKSFILSFQEDQSLWNLIPPELKIHRFNARPGWVIYDIKKLLHRPNNMRNFWIKEAERNLSLSEKGIVYAIIPPIDNAVLAYRLVCKYKYPLVLHYVDKVVEIDHEIVKHADLIFAVTNQIKANLAGHYGRQDIIVAENGYLQDIEVPEKTTISNPLRLIYAGSMTFQTRPEIFAQAYKALLNKNSFLKEKLHIDFFGPPNYYSTMFVQQHLTPHVRFMGFLPFSHLMEKLPQYDMGLASTTGDISFTSKVYQYLNAGLPLVTSSDDRCLSEFVDRNQIGLSANRSVENLARKLEELVHHPDRIMQWRKNVLAIKSQFSLRKRVQEISQMLKRLSGKI